MIDIDKIIKESHEYAERMTGATAEHYLAYCLHCITDFHFNTGLQTGFDCPVCGAEGKIQTYSQIPELSEYGLYREEFFDGCLHELCKVKEKIERLKRGEI